jgi:hypothetical protein
VSIDVSRSYIIPVENLSLAFAALAEIAPKRRTPREYSIELPDGSSVSFPFAPDLDRTPFVLKAGGDKSLSFDYAFRVGGGDDMVEYLRRNSDPPIFRQAHQVGRRSGHGVRAGIHVR